MATPGVMYSMLHDGETNTDQFADQLENAFELLLPQFIEDCESWAETELEIDSPLSRQCIEELLVGYMFQRARRNHR